MGTSLSGLTPATTFDGLLKTSDNDAITSSLKTIGSGDGTDSCLQLSNSALQVNGNLNIGSVHQVYQDLNDLIIKGNSGSTYLKYYTNSGNNLTNQFGIGNYLKYGVVVGEQTLPTTGQMLRVKGSGATSATTSLLVQNSAGSNALKVTDNGAIDFGVLGIDFSNDGSGGTMSVAGDRYIRLASSLNTYSAFNAHVFKTFGSGNYSEAMRITGNTDQFVGIGEPTPTAKLHVKVGTTQDSIAKFEDPRATTDYIEIKNDSILTDYTGLYWGTTAKIRSKQTGAMFLDCTSGILFADGNSARSKIDANGNMSIGSATIPASTRVTIKGQGATSATTSLLVENSDGTEHLKVTDDGAVDVRQNLTVNHATNSSRFLRFGWGSVSANDTASELSIYGGGSNNGSIMYLNGSTKGTAPQAIGMKTTGVLIAPSLTQSSFAPSAQLHVKGAGNDATTTALLVENSDGTSMFRIKDSGYVDVNPTNSAGGSLQVRGDSTDYLIFANANDNYVGIGGTQSSSSVRAYIKGKGATSATTALLVENSSGTDTLEVRDDGRVVAGTGATTNANGTFNVLHGVSNLTTRVFTVSRDSVLRGMDINSGGSTKISDSSGDQSFSHTATAVLEVSSTSKGFLPPRMTGEQIDAIELPASGLIIYNTTSNKAVCYNGTSWNDMF